MAKRVGVDKWLFGVVLLLVLFGLVTVFSASAVMAQAESGFSVCVCWTAGGVGAAWTVGDGWADAGGLPAFITIPGWCFPRLQ